MEENKMMNPMELLKQFPKFKQDMMAKNPGMNPQEMVNQMVSSGKISQAQFEQARQMAQQFGSMFK
jgi:hypothetical protein